MPVMFGMFQSDRTRSGFSDADLVQRVAAVLGLDDVVVVVAGLAQGADDDLPHDAAVVGDQDLHSGTSFSVVLGRIGGPAAPCTEMVRRRRATGRRRGTTSAGSPAAGAVPDLGAGPSAGRPGQDALTLPPTTLAISPRASATSSSSSDRGRPCSPSSARGQRLGGRPGRGEDDGAGPRADDVDPGADARRPAGSPGTGTRTSSSPTSAASLLGDALHRRLVDQLGDDGRASLLRRRSPVSSAVTGRPPGGAGRAARACRGCASAVNGLITYSWAPAASARTIWRVLALRGDHHHRHLPPGRVGADGGDELQPVHHRHVPVDADQVGDPARPPSTSRPSRPSPASHLVAEVLEDPADDAAHGAGVVDHQSTHRQAPFSGR